MFLHQEYVVLGLILLLTIISGERSQPNAITKEAQIYLSKYGYIDMTRRNNNAADIVHSNTWTKALKDFQKFFGLNETGIVDENTHKFMTLSRCGLPDNIKRTHKRQKRHSLEGSKWLINDLTFKIVNYPENLRKEDVDSVIARAFEVWRKHTDLNFTPTNSDQAIIKISFLRGNHDDNLPFDGRGGTLAHAFFPTSGGQIHFDADENWTINSEHGSNLFQVALHEIGHTLGLHHSEVPSAVMAPVYKDNLQDFELHPDDIEGIRKLYGKNSSPTTYNFNPYGFNFGR